MSLVEALFAIAIAVGVSATSAGLAHAIGLSDHYAAGISVVMLFTAPVWLVGLAQSIYVFSAWRDSRLLWASFRGYWSLPSPRWQGEVDRVPVGAVLTVTIVARIDDRLFADLGHAFPGELPEWRLPSSRSSLMLGENVVVRVRGHNRLRRVIELDCAET